MGEFRLAGAYVEARMDRTKLDADIAKLKRETPKLKVTADLDDRAATTRIAALVKTRRMKLGVDLDDRAVTTSLQRLTRSRTIQVKIDLDDTALNRLTSRSVDITADLNDAALRRTERALDKLTAVRTVRILATADTRVAADEIRNLTQRRRVRIGVDVDTRVAAADIANLTRNRMLRVTADADTAAAAARLALLTRDRRVNIRTNMLGLGSLGSLGSSLGSAGASAGMMGSRFMMLASAALMALPAVAALGQAIVQMGPAAAVAVPALGSLITMGAALGVGLHGVGTAFKSAFETGASSATSAASATRALESAQINVARSARALREAQVDAARQIVDAQKRVKQASQEVRDTEVRAAAERRAALRRVADAERDLADAQKAATRAQEGLNEARKTAADQLEDLGNRLKDAELSQRDAVMDVADAEKELNALKAKGAAANADDLARAQLNYDKAVQRLSEQRIETQRLQEDSAEAAKKGVEGSDAVKAAHDRVADAQRNVGDKARGVGDAQAEAAAVAKSGADSVRAAQQALADAQQGVADAQTAASRQVRGAQEALADANRAVAAAMAQGSTEATKFNDAMSKLSPNARSFVEAVKGIAPAWSAVRVDVQDALFRGLGTTLTRMSTAVLPAVRDGLVGMAGVLNRMGTGLMDTFTKLGNQGLLKRMFDGFTEGMKPLEKVPGQLAQGFVQLSIAAAPAFKRLTTAAGNAMSGITDELTQAFKSGALEKAINNAIEIAKQFGHLLGDIFGTVGNIMKAASAGAGDALGGIGAMFKELRRITAMPEVQQMLTTIFRAVNDIAKLIAGTLGAVIMAVLPLLAALAPTVSALAQALGPVLADLAEALGKALMPIIQALLPIVAVVGKALMDVATAIMPLLGPIGSLIAAVVAALAPVLGVVLDVIVQLVTSLAGPLITVINALIPIVGIFGQFIGQLAPIMLPLLTTVLQLLPPLAQLAVSLLTLAMQVITPLMPIIIMLAGLLAGVLAGALNILVPVLTTVIGWITLFVDKVTAGVKWVVDGFQWLYDKLVGHSIIPDLVRAIVKWFTDLWDSAKKIFNLIKDSIIGAWNATWKNVRQVWDTVWGGIKGSFTGAWKWIRDSVSLLKQAVTTAWSNMWTGARDKAMSIFTTIRTKIGDFKNGVTSAFTSLRDGIGKIWSGIQSKLSGPIKWVIGNVYNDGIRRMWNTIAGKISSKIMLPAIGLKFARGGVVPGTGTGDTVPAMLTPNERVLSLAQVAKLGGHRAIDAMLGKDRSQGRTGGNPDNRVAQGMQHFDKGGIIGTISDLGGAAWGTVKGGFDWAKDLVIGGLKSAAQKAISSIVRPLINMIPDGGSSFGKLAKGIPNSALDQMLVWLGKEDKKAVGGPGVQRGLSWAKTQAGKPYQWGGNGNPSWDCSGFVSAIESVIRGESPHRRWATGAFSGANAPGGWVRNLVSPYQIGITNAGVGHTAGTIAGVNVESRGGGGGVIVGSRARGANNSMWTDRYGFQPATKYDTGGLLQPGRTIVDNHTGKPEAVLSPEDRVKFEAIVQGGGAVTIQNLNVNGTFDFSSPTARKQAADAMVAEMNEALRVWNRSRAR
ncbi:hypothetical protein ACFWDI_28405 [Streptomyces sp. NPDC060064]|uniref:hypothetical protein n=1 Tax=Streptomyces sp. NPDC060064 TaxID=3347049 RepID=UPI003695930D